MDSQTHHIWIRNGDRDAKTILVSISQVEILQTNEGGEEHDNVACELSIHFPECHGFHSTKFSLIIPMAPPSLHLGNWEDINAFVKSNTTMQPASSAETQTWQKLIVQYIAVEYQRLRDFWQIGPYLSRDVLEEYIETMPTFR